jgi:integrase
MQAKKPLTDRAIKALPPAEKGKRRLVWDALVPGLAVRVTDTGQRSFVLVTRYPGSANPAPRTIGKVGAISLADARTTAQSWLTQIANGIDPANADEQHARGTLRAICTDYWQRDGARLRSLEVWRSTLVRLVFPVLGPCPINEIKRSEIVRLLDRIEDERGPSMANQTLAILRRIMNWHAARSDDFRSPIVRGMARAAGVSRDRILMDDELQAVWRITASYSGPVKAGPSPVFCAYVRFLLLTAARRNEVVGLRWAEIANGDWTLPAARNKTGLELVRPLSRAALEIVEGMPKVCEFVFSRNGKGAMGGIAEMKAAFSYASGVNGWTLHDLRRTARSLMSRAGVPSDHAERCLGHVIGGVRGVYDRHAYRQEMLQAYEKLAGLIETIVDPQPNVVAMRGER